MSSETTGFWVGLAVLAVAAFFVPWYMGLDRVTAFVMGFGVAVVYVVGCEIVAKKFRVRFEDDRED